MAYDWQNDAKKSYDAAIDAMREKFAPLYEAGAKRVYQIGEHILIEGDCLKVMPALGKVDAVVTDPPYGIEGSWSGGNSHGWGKFSGEAAKWDIRPEWFGGFVSSQDCPAVIWGGQYFEGLPRSGSWLIWDKVQRGVSFGEAELAWTNLGKPIRAFSYGAVKICGEGKQHPTQKPLPLMRWCIEHLPKDAQTILDPFMGSGTTGVACAQLGRKFTGIELDPDYFDIAVKRVREAYSQPSLFEPERPKPAKTADLFEGGA